MSSFSKVYTVNPQTTLSCIVRSLRNNKICPSRENEKFLNLFSLQLNLSCSDGALLVSFQIMLMKGSHSNFHFLHQKPH